MNIKLVENGVSNLFKTNADFSTINNQFNLSYSLEEFIKNIEECGYNVEKIETSITLDFDV